MTLPLQFARNARDPNWWDANRGEYRALHVPNASRKWWLFRGDTELGRFTAWEALHHAARRDAALQEAV